MVGGFIGFHHYISLRWQHEQPNFLTVTSDTKNQIVRTLLNISGQDLSRVDKQVLFKQSLSLAT